MSSTLLSSYIVQAVGALITAVLFGFLSATYRRPFLRHWARSWSAMCVSLSAAGMNHVLSGPSNTGTRLLISGATAIAGYLQITWLLLGAMELTAPDAAARIARWQRWIFAGAVVVGHASVLVLLNDPDPLGARFMVRVGVRTGVTGLAFVLAAAAVWFTKLQGSGVSLGRALVAGASGVYGAAQLHVLWTMVFDAGTAAGAGSSIYASFVDFVLVFTIGLGVVIWLLEQEHKVAQETSARVAQLAFHDPLTGVPNRQLLMDHLSMAIPQARRDKAKLAVFFIDLDRFKVINDSLGHSAGDKVLSAVSSRVKSVLRETDTVGRMGGDEFVVVAQSVRGVEDAVHVAQKMREVIREPINAEGRELFVSASMGVAMYPDDGDDAEALLKNADTAMYRAKSQGSDLFQLYTPEMNAHAAEQLALESALRRAVETKEFELHYQPIVRTADGSICALETMLRWRHPVLGLVRPEQFIRLAESTGLIVPIGEWTLRTACKQLGEWRSAGNAGLRLAVNLSARELKQPEFVEKVKEIIAETSTPPTALEFEITEMSATQSEPAVIDRLRSLRELGVRISIDDFGTGFSSVSVLRVFPVDSLKIDTSFVRDLVLDPNDAAIAAAVVAIAKSMGLAVIAEGVENPSQLDFLRQHGCEMWQGYLCCPPVVAGEVRALLGRRSGGTQRRPTPTDVETIKH